MTMSQSALAIFLNVMSRVMPALLMRMSTGPTSLCTFATQAALETSLRLGLDVAPRRRLDRAIFAIAELGASGHLVCRMLREPLAPCRPPASRHALRRFQPTLRIAAGFPIHPIVAFFLRWRVDH